MRRAAPVGTAHASGFTLLEVLLVLGVLAVAAAVALPEMAAWQRRQAMDEAVRSVRSALEETRLRAIETGRSWDFEWTSGASSHVARRLDGEQSVNRDMEEAIAGTLPTGVTFATGRDDFAGSGGSIRFRPDGSAEERRITLADASGDRRVLAVDWLTGSAREER